MITRSVGLLVAMLALAACGTAEDPDLTAVGAHATAASARIVYPESAPPLGVVYETFAAGWADLAETVDGVTELRESSRDGDRITYVADTDASGVALDVVVVDATIEVAQLTLVDAVGDEDEPHLVAAVAGFLDLIGMTLDAATLLPPDEPLFAEREFATTESTVALYLASNEDSILVGAIGAS